jgi:hypothetical protein
MSNLKNNLTVLISSPFQKPKSGCLFLLAEIPICLAIPPTKNQTACVTILKGEIKICVVNSNLKIGLLKENFLVNGSAAEVDLRLPLRFPRLCRQS